MRPRFLLIALAAASALLVPLLAPVSPAGAARAFNTGITTTDLLPPEPLSLERVKRAGASYKRVIIFWRFVAPPVEPESWDPTDPRDPNYDWSSIDQQMELADEAGVKTLALVYLAPEWAERCQVPTEGICNPDPAAFADFTEAAAKRYSGQTDGLPRVRFWQAWNEPNLAVFLEPQFRNGRKVSPGIYRILNNRLAARVRAVSAANRIVGGGLAPIKKQGSLGPHDFMRRLLCLKGRTRPVPSAACSAKTSFDIWSTNPYTTGGPFHASSGIDDVSLGDLPEVPPVLRAALRNDRINTTARSIPFWVTEFSWDSRPPDPGGVPMKTMAKWVPEAMFQAWRSGVTNFFWLSLRDWPRDPSLPFSGVPFESGLYFRGETLEEDRPKPFLHAFRFPFVAYGTRSGGMRVWGRTPTSTAATLVISYRLRGSWRKVGTVRAGANGVFSKLLPSRRVTRNRGFARARVLGPGGSQSLSFQMKPIPDYFQRPFG
jgi:hypothetical protein